MINAILCAVMLVVAVVGGGRFPADAAMERANMPIEVLEANATVVFVGTCTRIEQTATRNGGFEDTTYFHHMRVERVCRDASETVKVGDTVAVISQTHLWVAEGNPPPSGSGHRGMPAQGGRKRVYCTVSEKSGGAMVWLNALAPNGWQAPERSVVFVAADDEYKSEATLPRLAEWLSRDAKGIIAPTQAYSADPVTGKLDVTRRDHIANLDKLAYAEAAVLYLRWRELDAANWAHLEQYLMTGRPLVGLRTSTHMLRTQDAARGWMNDDLPIRVFGQKWIRHAGSATRTRVLAPGGSDHPVVRGIKGGFVVRSWLYEVLPLPADCTVLVWGEVEGPAGILEKQPVVWVREAQKETVTPFENRGRAARRMAFTTLGHPEDFEHPEVRRLVEQMVLWACGEENAIPAAGVSADGE